MGIELVNEQKLIYYFSLAFYYIISVYRVKMWLKVAGSRCHYSAESIRLNIFLFSFVGCRTLLDQKTFLLGYHLWKSPKDP